MANCERPIGIDLFSGAGGLSLGFEQAGFDVVAAVEIDPIHASAHKFNFPHCAVIPKSVASLTGKEIRKASGIGSRRIDVVFGGPPCQGFSLIGQRALDDPRNSLVREFLRIVCELKPSYFVFENVKGLTLGRHRAFLKELIAEFESVGYNVRQPWRVLQASNYGVPQDRERLILMGARKNQCLPDYPPETTRASGSKSGLFSLPEGPSCADALGDLPDAEEYEALIDGSSLQILDWKEPKNSYARELRCLDSKCWHHGYRRKWNPSLLTCSGRTEHTQISRRRFLETTAGTVEPISRFYKLPPNGISNTLRAGTDSARGAFTSPRPIHYAKPRCITVREMARLHGFPDWFQFHATKWHGARQIGNAVPPPLGRAIGGCIMGALGVKPAKPKKTLKLGNPSLLEMGMKEAAEYWGICVPIGKRNRKSGAKKRKQEEIERIRLSSFG